MLKKIVFLIWDEALLEDAAELKRRIDKEGGTIHIWGKGEEPEDSRKNGDEKTEAGSRKERDGELQDSGSDAADGEGKRNGAEGESAGEEAEEKNRKGKDGECGIDYMEEKGISEDKKEEKPRCLTEYDKESTLFVTDKGLILQELKRLERYVIALLYEKNRQEDFTGASYAVTDIGELTLDSFDKAYRRMAGKPWTVLETERCIVRETTVEDVDEFYRIYAEPSITCYMDRLYDTPEEEKAYMRAYIEKIYGFYGYGMWSIVQKETGRVIGRAGLSWREGFDIPEIGFVIEVPCQHMGYAYEVCSAIVTYGMEELEFQRIQALVEKENEASMRLCRKLGFERVDSVESGGKVYERFIIQVS